MESFVWGEGEPDNGIAFNYMVFGNNLGNDGPGVGHAVDHHPSSTSFKTLCQMIV